MNPLSRTHVLFDLDGTLVDSRKAVAACYAQVFKERLGMDFPPPGIETGDIYAIRPVELFARFAPERVDELHQAYQDGYPAAAAQWLTVFDGADRLIHGLVKAGRRPSLVTNKGLARTLIDLARAGIDTQWFDAIVAAEDTAERKPHPAPILLGLQRAGADATDAIYVGDGPQDVLAARACGMPVIGLTYGFYPAQALAKLEPDALAHSMDELAQLLGVSIKGTA